MKLKTKLQLSQLLVFVVIFCALTIILPNIIYISARKTEREKAMSFNEQIMMQVDNCFEELKRFASVVSKDEELNRLLHEYLEEPSKKTEAKIRLYLSKLIITDNVPSYRVLGIYVDVYTGYENIGFTTVGLSSAVVSHMKQVVLPIYEKNKSIDMYIEPFPFEKGESKSLFGSGFSMVYGFIHNYKKNGITGSISIISSFDEIIYIVENISDYSKDYLFLTDDNIRVKPSVSNSRIDPELVLNNLVYGKSFKEGYYQDADSVSTVRISQHGNWKLISRLTRKDIISNNRSLILMVEILMALFGIFIVAIMVPIVKRFTKPLGELSRQMEEIANGNLDVKVRVYTKDEIGEVGEAFNIMADKLKDIIDKLIEKEKLEETMRYSLLISQVDPHFIYNTMNTITYLAQKGRNQDVIAVNKAMIEILKDRLRIEIADIYDTVEQEVSVVEKYLIIQNYRYEGTFKTKIIVPEEVRHYLIAKNLLQPLVENALIHGILANKDENGEILGGCITIKIIRENDRLVITVQDNGAGMSVEVINKIENYSKTQHRGTNIGIRNIRERIKYIYGDGQSFKIRSKVGEGTCVTLKLPIIEESKPRK